MRYYSDGLGNMWVDNGLGLCFAGPCPTAAMLPTVSQPCATFPAPDAVQPALSTCPCPAPGQALAGFDYGLGAQWMGAKVATNGQPCSMPRVARGPNGQKVCKCWFTDAGELDCPGCCSALALR